MGWRRLVTDTRDSLSCGNRSRSALECPPLLPVRGSLPPVDRSAAPRGAQRALAAEASSIERPSERPSAESFPGLERRPGPNLESRHPTIQTFRLTRSGPINRRRHLSSRNMLSATAVDRPGCDRTTSKDRHPIHGRYLGFPQRGLYLVPLTLIIERLPDR